MNAYRNVGLMEDEYGILTQVRAGDWTVLNGWKLTVTQAAKDCDCGKGMLCPYIIQERVN